MDSLTVVQVVAIIGGIVGALKAIDYLCQFFRGFMDKWLAKGMEPVMEKLDEMGRKIDNVDMNSCKNFLTHAMSDAWKEDLPSVEKERIHEAYEHYSKMGGNSYIHTEYERLTEAGKI